MNAVHRLMTDHIGVWTGANAITKSGRGRASGSAGTVYGIKKLRELILELAVRGKLVPQDANDEPASALLERVRGEKARLILAGKIKKGKPIASLTDEKNLESLPDGWVCARLADIANIINGRAYKKEELLNKGTPVLRVGNLFTSDHWYYSDLVLDDDKYCNSGDLLFAWSASFGPFIWDGEKSIYHYHIWKLDPYGGNLLFKRYLYTFLLEQTQKIKSAGHGVMMIHMTKEEMEKLVVYLPPILEQHRIVAKVDELMALCDQLETGHSDAIDAHEKLVSHLLATLTESQDSADFSAGWQRIAEHFDMLFSTEASIDALKKTLLQLAVMGKLAPQDPSDEPASALLERIRVEKAKLVFEGKIKKDKPLAAIIDGEKPFELPQGWQWVRLGELVIKSGAGWSPSCEGHPRIGNDWGVLKVSAVSWGQFLPDENKALPVALNARLDCVVETGDFLVSRANTAELVARSVVVADCPANLMLSDKIVRFRLSSLCDKRFINLANLSLFSRNYYAAVAGGTSSSMKNVSREQILNLIVGKPPITEQHRIVAKVEELMALCNRMKASIADAGQLQRKLADVMVAQAVA